MTPTASQTIGEKAARGLVQAMDEVFVRITRRDARDQAVAVGAELLVAALVTRVVEDERVIGRRPPHFARA